MTRYDAHAMDGGKKTFLGSMVSAPRMQLPTSLRITTMRIPGKNLMQKYGFIKNLLIDNF